MKPTIAPISKEELRTVYAQEGIFAQEMEEAYKAFLLLINRVMPRRKVIDPLWMDGLVWGVTMYKIGKMRGKQEERARRHDGRTAAE